MPQPTKETDGKKQFWLRLTFASSKLKPTTSSLQTPTHTHIEQVVGNRLHLGLSRCFLQPPRIRKFGSLAGGPHTIDTLFRTFGLQWATSFPRNLFFPKGRSTPLVPTHPVPTILTSNRCGRSCHAAQFSSSSHLVGALAGQMQIG
ncbi:hypothetical protein AA313_de0202802 [Arthrobotrys entomopaga]|nr:hypothetical protein AA313_de0202802 [Arthrobotrys entomopaga]